MDEPPTERELLAPLLRRVFPSGVREVARGAEGITTRVWYHPAGAGWRTATSHDRDLSA
jgi:hypothetical protein